MSVNRLPSLISFKKNSAQFKICAAITEDTEILTWSFNLVRVFIKRIMTTDWFLKVPPCLRSRDCEFGIEAFLIQTRLDRPSSDECKLQRPYILAPVSPHIC